MTKRELRILVEELTHLSSVTEDEADGGLIAEAVSEALLEAGCSWPGAPAMERSGFTQMHFETARDISALEEAALRTEPEYGPAIRRLAVPEIVRMLHAAMGMVTEAGELLDSLKKAIFYGKPLDTVNYCEELGDASWYLRIGALAAGSDITDVMMTNVRKLRARYPEKFTEEKAITRDLGAERKVLEERARKLLEDDGA